MVQRHDEHTYAIIAGATRAGTTSLFLYLADHPDICRSSIKETRFFLDGDYPIKPDISYGQGLSAYLSLFHDCAGDPRVRLEATPDYMYSSVTSQRIASSRLRAKLIFLLREPVDRLISWHKFAMMRGLIDETTLDQFIDRQAHADAVKHVPYYFRALHQGRYSEYLTSFLERFAQDDILILFFEEMKEDTLQVVRQAAEFVGVDSSVYDDSEFAVHNPSKGIKNRGLSACYLRAKTTLRRISRRAPAVRRALKSAGGYVDRAYSRVNVQSEQSGLPIVTAEHADFLRQYYAGEYDSIARLIGRQVPWHQPDLRIVEA